MYTLLMQIFARLPKKEKGQDLTEYGLLVALIAIVVIAAVTVFGENVSSFFEALAAEVSDWTGLIP